MRSVILVLFWVASISAIAQETWSQDGNANIGRVLYNSSGNLGYAVRTNSGGWAWQFVDYYNTPYFHVGYGTGNVGIGTISPAGKLQITGNSGWDTNAQLFLTNGATNYGRTNLVITGRYQDSNDGWYFGTAARSSIVFASNASNAWENAGVVGTEKFSIQHQQGSNSLGFLSSVRGNFPLMVITQAGNIGVGTPSPDQKLTVNGTVHATRVKVESSVPGPDYVFEKDYPLPSLAEIKSYIDEKKHLPEVPSAKEIEQKGIDVGEMNMLLLKKVEELTLYIIAQQKRLKEIEERIDVKPRN